MRQGTECGSIWGAHYAIRDRMWQHLGRSLCGKEQNVTVPGALTKYTLKNKALQTTPLGERDADM